jgi:hypothetical protein
MFVADPQPDALGTWRLNIAPPLGENTRDFVGDRYDEARLEALKKQG